MLRYGAMAGFALMLTLTLSAQQQGSSTPTSQSGQSGQSQAGQGSRGKAPAGKKDAAKTGSTAEQNPFPQAESQAAAQQDQQGGQQPNGQSAPAKGAPSAPLPQTNAPAPAKKNSAADQNPFPEAESESAAKQSQQQKQAGKQKGDYSSSDSGMKGLGLPTPGEVAVPPASEKEDLRVGKFYLQTGDWKGAYDRYVAASQLNPGSAEAVWGLAEAERHLGMTKQAVQNYELYLSALPDGPRAKDARKTLKDLGVKP